MTIEGKSANPIDPKSVQYLIKEMGKLRRMRGEATLGDHYYATWEDRPDTVWCHGVWASTKDRRGDLQVATRIKEGDANFLAKSANFFGPNGLADELIKILMRMDMPGQP